MSNFATDIRSYFDEFFNLVANEKDEWTVKGFIDIYKNIYTISLDTKVVSKIIELMIFPVILKFANEKGYDLVLSSHQNHYPDLSFISKKDGTKIALDLKSTYRVSPDRVNGMTLGAFTGYFRNRKSNKNITFPYGDYSKHFVLGIIYSKTDLYNAKQLLAARDIEPSASQMKFLLSYLSQQTEESLGEFMASLQLKTEKEDKKVRDKIRKCIIDERVKYSLDDLTDITSVVRDFQFFIQEKWTVAVDRPGSGNTKNIGSVTEIDKLINGQGPFTELKNGKKVFDDFWTYYLTKDMARAVDLVEPPYKNLETYFRYKG